MHKITPAKHLVSCLIFIGLIFCSVSRAQESAAEVCIYSQTSYKGSEFCTNGIIFVPFMFNTKSVIVPKGYKVTLYSWGFYRGSSVELTKSAPIYNGLNARSIKMEQTSAANSTNIAAIVPIISLLLNEKPVDPDDLDGDGFSNEVEDEYGTDPRDPDSTPPDQDGDKIPDDIDPDRDGDGIANEEEELRETDPDDPNDYPDTVAPTLSLSNQSSIVTTEQNINVVGNLKDPVQPYSGVADVYVTSSAYPATSFRGSYDIGSGVFNIEVPLVEGDNQLTIYAMDISGNQVQDSISVTQRTPPTIVSVTPVSGTVLTNDRANISGEIQTGLPPDQFVFTVNSSRVLTSATNQANTYHFDFNDVPLAPGDNRFRFVVSSDHGGDEKNIILQFLPDEEEDFDPPLIGDSNPVNASLINRESFRIAAQIESYAGPLTVEFDGKILVEPSDNRTVYALSEVVSFASGEDQLTVNIRATDSLNKETQRSFTFYKDSQAPIIILDQAYSFAPAVILVDQSPTLISGTVIDENLSSLLVNNQSLTLSPGASENSFTFNTEINVAASATTPVTIQAYDRSGNKAIIEVLLERSNQFSINALLPPDKTEFIGQGEPIEVQVVARTGPLLGGESVVAFVEGDVSESPLELTGTLAGGFISLSPTTGDSKIRLELRDSNGLKISQDEINVSVFDEDDIPVELIRIEPANNSLYIEPNKPIEIYFNRAIDSSLLEVKVFETVHGKSYVNQDPLGVDFINSEGYILADVNRDFEPVLGQLNAAPGDTSFEFSSNQYFSYHADIYVEVTYDGEQLSRTKFKVRELPTFINGGIADQFGQPIKGVKVELPELNRSTTTNGDGGFAFGYQESGDNIIPGGQYRLIVNSGFGNPDFGTINTKINIQGKRSNSLARFTLQELDKSIPFFNLSSGRVNNFVGGDLVIDLSNARALFANGRTSGPVHAQFLPFEHLGVTTNPTAMPHWMFGLQPKGINVEGDVELSIQIPKMRGSYDYINFDVYQYVVLLGYSQEGDVVEPVGVGKIENSRVVSVGKLHLTSLNYIGYAQVLPTLIDDLVAYENDEIGIQQLRAKLLAQFQ